MNILKIAYRNVSRHKRRSNLLAAAIAFGVMIILLVNSLTSGLITNTEKNFSSVLGGHIYISGEELLESGKSVHKITDTDVLETVLTQFEPYIADYQKRSTLGGTMIFRSASESGVIYGIDWSHESELVDSLVVTEGSLDRVSERKALVLPEDMAAKLGVVVGEEVLISLETVTGQANVGEFTVVALTKDTTGFGFTSTYANIDYVNELVGIGPTEYQSLNLILKDVTMINTISDQIRTEIEAIGSPVKPKETLEASMNPMAMFEQGDEEPWEGTRFDITTLNDFMDAVTQIVSILNGIAMGVFLVILLITMVGIMNTFRMIMIERVKEIGTMRAVGMKQKDVKRLFLLEAVILALRGAFIGIILEVAIILIVNLINFGVANRFAFLLNGGYLGLHIVGTMILLVTVIITVITLFSVSSSARKAAKMNPADALRA